MKIRNLLNQDIHADPNSIYNILENILCTSLNKHMPLR